MEQRMMTSLNPEHRALAAVENPRLHPEQARLTWGDFLIRPHRDRSKVRWARVVKADVYHSGLASTLGVDRADQLLIQAQEQINQHYLPIIMASRDSVAFMVHASEVWPLDRLPWLDARRAGFDYFAASERARVHVDIACLGFQVHRLCIEADR
jgi:hypothetical protein